MDWYVIDKNYVNYLNSIDPKVGYVEYGDRLKLHVGILITVNGTKYYVPISSPKEKHRHMRNSRDFHKLTDEQGKLYAVINLNNMIPVLDQYATMLSYNDLPKYRRFNNAQELTNYILLLQIEKTIIDSEEDTIKEKALKLYDTVTQYPESSIAMRCCNYRLLEEKMKEYTP